MAAGRVLRLAPRPLFLAGREDLLAELDARLAGGDGAGPRVVALCGLGGAGKTSVAVEYAHRHLGEVGVAWQFPAEDPAVLAAGFGELAAQLGAGAMGGDPVASVHGVLAAYPAEWLLVFDNAPDRASVARVRAPGRAGPGADHQPEPALAAGPGVEVPVLDPRWRRSSWSAAPVTRTGGRPLELAGELGGLPLALEQAAAYIQASGDSLAGYLALFRRAAGGPAGPRRADRVPGETVATTWGWRFADWRRGAPAAAGLLRLLACLRPRGDPAAPAAAAPPRARRASLRPEVASVLVPLLEDQLAAGDAVAALRRYSLVTPAGDGLVSVHRLVQAVTARPDARRAGRRVAAGRRRAGRGRDPRRPAAARGPGRCARRCCRTPRLPST